MLFGLVLTSPFIHSVTSFFVNFLYFLLHSLSPFPFSLFTPPFSFFPSSLLPFLPPPHPNSVLATRNIDNEEDVAPTFSECRRLAHKPRVPVQDDGCHYSCSQCSVGALGRVWTWPILDMGAQKWIKLLPPRKPEEKKLPSEQGVGRTQVEMANSLETMIEFGLEEWIGVY